MAVKSEPFGRLVLSHFSGSLIRVFNIVYCCLFLFHCCVCDAVGGSFEAEDSAVVYGAVDDGGCHLCIAQDGSPSGEFQVGGVDDGLFFVCC